MKATSSQVSFALRQSLLKQQMHEAFNLQEVKRLSILEAQWVHRFGLDTLPDLRQEHVPIPSEEIELELTDKACVCFAEDNVDNKEVHLDNYDSANEMIQQENDDSDDIVYESSHSQENKEILEALQPNSLPIKGDCLDQELPKNADKKASLPLPRPPSPHLARMRRWIPNQDDDLLPKAS